MYLSGHADRDQSAQLCDFRWPDFLNLYTRPGATPSGWPEYMPGMRDGRWDYVETSGRHFDRDKFEDFRTRFYRFQGWDPTTGWPTRDTLGSMNLTAVADELEAQGRLGR